MKRYIFRLLTNKHTSVAAFAYALCELMGIWFPEAAPRLGQTQDWIVVYGFLFGADARTQIPERGTTPYDKDIRYTEPPHVGPDRMRHPPGGLD